MHLKIFTLILILLPFIFSDPYQDTTKYVVDCDQCDDDTQICLFCHNDTTYDWACFDRSEAEWYCCGCNVSINFTGTCIACSSQSFCQPDKSCFIQPTSPGYIVLAVVIVVVTLAGIIAIIVYCSCKDRCGFTMTPKTTGGGGNPTNDDGGGDTGPTVDYGGGVDTGSTPMVDNPQPVVDYTPPPVVDYTPPPTVDFGGGGGGFEHHHHGGDN